MHISVIQTLSVVDKTQNSLKSIVKSWKSDHKNCYIIVIIPQIQYYYTHFTARLLVYLGASVTQSVRRSASGCWSSHLS